MQARLADGASSRGSSCAAGAAPARPQQQQLPRAAPWRRRAVQAIHALHIDRRQHMELAWQRQREREARRSAAPVLGQVVEVEDLEHLEALLERSGSSLVVVAFYTRSCGACKALLAEFAALAEEAKAAQVRAVFARHNLLDEFDGWSDVSVWYRARVAPTILFFDGGAVVKRVTLHDVRRMGERAPTIRAAMQQDLQTMRRVFRQMAVRWHHVCCAGGQAARRADHARAGGGRSGGGRGAGWGGGGAEAWAARLVCKAARERFRGATVVSLCCPELPLAAVQEAWRAVQGDGERQQRLASTRAACGDVAGLAWLRGAGCDMVVHGRFDVDSVCWTAAKRGKVAVLEWARGQGLDLWNACCGAAAGGQLAALRWARAQAPPLPWGDFAYMVCWHAARRGDVEMLRWARAQAEPAPWNEEESFSTVRGHQPSGLYAVTNQGAEGASAANTRGVRYNAGAAAAGGTGDLPLRRVDRAGRPARAAGKIIVADEEVYPTSRAAASTGGSADAPGALVRSGNYPSDANSNLGIEAIAATYMGARAVAGTSVMHTADDGATVSASLRLFTPATPHHVDSTAFTDNTPNSAAVSGYGNGPATIAWGNDVATMARSWRDRVPANFKSKFDEFGDPVPTGPLAAAAAAAAAGARGAPAGGGERRRAGGGRGTRVFWGRHCARGRRLNTWHGRRLDTWRGRRLDTWRLLEGGTLTGGRCRQCMRAALHTEQHAL
ncbi:thioredoxin-like 4 [Scenedesmus sp. PABB004]|nr:thioredoxin-like 4 [Scenedesmus sp. PABB004]